MLGWMIVFLVVGIVIGSLVTSSCINDYVRMIMLSKREKETLREISQWKEFYANWKPKTRAKLERMNLVANVSPKGCVENYQLTEKGHSLLQQLTEAGAF